MEKILVQDLPQGSINDLFEENKSTESKKEESLLFVELERGMFKDNKYILDKYFRNETGNSCCFANLLRIKENLLLEEGKELTNYIISKILKQDFGCKVSLKGYRYNPEHYRFNDIYLQLDYEEDLFREQEDEPYDPYEGMEKQMLDYEVFDRLYNAVISAIKSRKLILLGLDTVPAMLNRALEANGLELDCGFYNRYCKNKLAELDKLATDLEVKEWMKTKPTDLSFDKGDYVETYQKALRSLFGFKVNEDMTGYCLDVIHNEEDLWETEILENFGFEEVPLINNTDLDEDEYLENNEIFE